MKRVYKEGLGEHARLSKKTTQSRKELEKKVVEGAERALREYRNVFERLAEYDRAERV